MPGMEASSWHLVRGSQAKDLWLKQREVHTQANHWGNIETFFLNLTSFCVQAKDVGWSILDLAVSPDGEHLVYSSDSLHQVSLLGFEEKHELLPLCPDDMQFCIFSVSFSQDSKELLGGANDGYLYLYDREANRQSSRIEAHEDDAIYISSSKTYGDVDLRPFNLYGGKEIFRIF
jgi:WD40 repeat protein